MFRLKEEAKQHISEAADSRMKFTELQLVAESTNHAKNTAEEKLKSVKEELERYHAKIKYYSFAEKLAPK